ncbi:hypothetical protein [Polyangium sp. 6x1]|uniref:hypothetical protein n=1 Tax=Polyangium sp. 6x1 TaxID=3042689 RepID=UPI002482D8AD|nr:hypothetical protein [Polyangium sp. 6x1]MDI1449661.1 hypothetical protein [Polyangium sp. 6x1]
MRDDPSSARPSRIAPQRNRASFVQAALREVEALEPSVRDRILERTGPTSLAAIRGALGVQWLPPEPCYDLLEALYAELGEAGTRALYRRSMNRHFENPLFRALIDGFLRRTGMSPQALMRFVPFGRALIAENAGHMVYELRGEHEGAIWLREYPVEHFRSGAVVQLLGGCWEAGLDFVGVDGKVEVEGLDLERGACDFVLTWKARR